MIQLGLYDLRGFGFSSFSTDRRYVFLLIQYRWPIDDPMVTRPMNTLCQCYRSHRIWQLYYCGQTTSRHMKPMLLKAHFIGSSLLDSGRNHPIIVGHLGLWMGLCWFSVGSCAIPDHWLFILYNQWVRWMFGALVDLWIGVLIFWEFHIDTVVNSWSPIGFCLLGVHVQEHASCKYLLKWHWISPCNPVP